MKEFQIETAQNVSIHQNIASLGDRMLAYIIDSFVIYIYLIGVIMLLLFMDLDMRDTWAIYLLVSLPAFLYYVLLETFFNGQTIGKKLMQLRVVKLDGSKPSFASYFLRWIMRIVDVTLTSGGVAILTILIRGKGQRVGDIAAGTSVISEKKRVSINDTILKEISVDYIPTYSQVTLLKDSEMQTVKSLYKTAVFKGQHHIVLSLHKRLVEVMQIETQEKPIDFVNTVIKDYNYYTQHM
ncbi:RDD family protein [Snuella sedimenti]|uniref:RDD family protein n=1 Tax=Snuella sedimenti TaxID=2798802 RepID=A0A8J7IFX9_9FLAO|nr:RDD family protein [Snuella sedimenti]MBJ6368492.1 RDD family protein [Snuella sedimenti]